MEIISLAVAIFPWRSEDFAVSPSSLAAKPPRKITLAASRQVNHVSLALHSWRILLGGQPPRMISLAVLVYSLAVFGRQGNSSLV